MFTWRFVLLLAAAFVGGIVTFPIAAFAYMTSDSFGASAWRNRLARELEQHGEVRVADLVSFKWDKIYFVRTYDLAGSRRRDEMGLSEDFWWGDDQRYWTIVYRRAGSAPFIVKMSAAEWTQVSRFLEADRNAKIRRAPADHPGYTKCRTARYCLLLER